MVTGPVLERSEFFIDGEWRKPSGGGRIEVISPATEEVIGSAPEAGAHDVDAAVTAARRSFDGGEWRTASVADRSAVVRRALEILGPNTSEIAALVTSEMGMPITWSEQ